MSPLLLRAGIFGRARRDWVFGDAQWSLGFFRDYFGGGASGTTLEAERAVGASGTTSGQGSNAVGGAAFGEAYRRVTEKQMI